jgi:eukaryotic-like serine/threonine-protein kinase
MNSPNRLQQIEALFHATLERDAADRAAFLAQACAADSSLLGEVQALLAAHEGTGDFSSFALGLPAQVGAEEQATALLPKPLTVATPRTINQYKILSLLGKGGMGEVWLAEDTRLKRQVALKLLPAEFTHDAERLRRFEQEALAISALNHPNIITIHEIGESAAGRFIVMELVAGRTLRTQATAGVTRCPRCRDHAPRHQTRQYYGARGWLREGARFRPGAVDGEPGKPCRR